MKKLRGQSRARRLPLAGAVLALGLAGTRAHSQEQPAPPGETLETVTVTGSLIKRTDFETPSPIQVMTAEDLKDTGYTSISEVLRNLSANGQGTLTQTNPFSFAGGASGVALRGLTVGATLTLVDGERMVAYPLTDDGQRSFVDVNSIPFSVVDRVDVLKDGASAEYGSDAIAGVINVILKKSFTGFEFNAEGGETGKHDGATEHVNAIGGIGNLDSDGYNAYLSVEWRHQDEIYLHNRSGLWTNLNWAPFGGVNGTPGAGSAYLAQSVAYPASLTGYLLNPNTFAIDGSEIYLHNACTDAKLLADQCTYIDRQYEIQPQAANLNVLGRLTKTLGGGWEAKITASLFRSEAEQIFGHSAITPNTGPNTELEPGGTPTVIDAALFPLTVPASYPGNTFGTAAPFVYTFGDLGQGTTQFVTDTYRLFTDFSGAWAGWQIDATAGAMYVAVTQRTTAGLNPEALQNVLNSGYILGSPGGAALFAPIEEVKDTNSLQDVDLRGTRSLTQLPGGPLSLGVGLGYNHRYLYDLSPPTVANGTQSGSIAYALGSTTDYAVYAELVAPVLKPLELDGAVRWDHYNSYGSSTTPKFGLKYTPFRQLTLRGTWGQGFRAPNPAEAGTAGNFFAAGSFPDPVLCKENGQGQQLPGSFPITCTEFPTGLQTTSPDLKPERSTNYTAGFIVTPVEQLKLSLDYWDVRINRDVVSASELVNLGIPSQSLQFTTVRGPPVMAQEVTAACENNLPACPNVLTPVGLILFQEFPYVNATQTEVNGLDLDLASHFDIGRAGKLSATLNYSHMFHYYLSAAGLPTTDLAGTHGPSGVSGDTGNPKDRAVLALSWDRASWDVTTSVNYVGAFNLTDPSIGLDDCGSSILNSGKWVNAYNGPASFCQVDRFVDVDFYTEYTFSDHLRIHGTILNLFDKPPPLDMQTYGSAGNYSNAFHDAGAIGRFFSIGATYKF
ncbi:MAG: TonB-dependent receptor [Gammaproteobacteria bacterium]|nr:TonB-dependent receptor [Gammaproteobacteria bacterium]